MKNTISTRMSKRSRFSFKFLRTLAFKKSSVSVEREVNTKEDSVDMEAERTRTITTPIKISGREESMKGMMPSYITPPCSLYKTGLSNNRPDPPRK